MKVEVAPGGWYISEASDCGARLQQANPEVIEIFKSMPTQDVAALRDFYHQRAQQLNSKVVNLLLTLIDAKGRYAVCEAILHNRDEDVPSTE